MTEVETIHKLLAQRCSSVPLYGAVESGDSREASGSLFILLKAESKDVLICLQSSLEGQIVAALSYVLPHRSSEQLHLNYWKKDKDLSPEGQIADLWTQFWKDERTNQELGRMLWMHGPVLPSEDLNHYDTLTFFS